MSTIIDGVEKVETMKWSDIEQLKRGMDAIIEKLTFKSKANQLRDMAIGAMEAAMRQHEAIVNSLEEKIKDAEHKVGELDSGLYWVKRNNAALEEKVQLVIKKANKERKDSTARANRFKAKYDRLLDDIDKVLPGSKELLTKKGTSEQLREKRLGRLNHLIKRQQEKLDDLTEYDPKYGSNKLEGYGRESRILQAMLIRKQREEKRPTYADDELSIAK